MDEGSSTGGQCLWLPDDISSRRRVLDSAIQRVIDKAAKAIVRHWLFLLNLSNGFTLLGTFLAPFLVAVGMKLPADVIYLTYRLICSQRPSHSYYLWGEKTAMEQRMIAMYAAALLAGLIFVPLRRRLHRLDWRLMILLNVPMAIDVFSQTFALRDSDWFWRTTTGGLGAFAFIAWALPLLEHSIGSVSLGICNKEDHVARSNGDQAHKLTALTKSRYDRQANRYDQRNNFVERRLFAQWRKLQWSKVKGPRILEIGVGTGANFPYYPSDARVTAIDLSDKMLDRARRKADEASVAVDLLQMDAQALDFADHTFDTVLATCVFCSVPDPLSGLQEARRVLKPDGRLVLLEHVRSESPFGVLMDIINPMMARMMGANINRRTVENVKKAGFRIESVDSFFFDIVKVIVACPE